MLQDSLNDIGIICSEIKHNPSYEELYAIELSGKLEGFEQATLTTLGAVAIDTGEFTGRSPKDKYIVEHPDSKDHIWWHSSGSDNQPLSQEAWDHVKNISIEQLNSAKTLYVMDGFCGANPDTRLNVRLVTEVAWMAHFFKNMFIRPTEEELKDFKPDWTIFNACKTTNKEFEKYGMRSEVFGAFNLEERMTCIGGTWYGGEIKKGIFTIMHYFLPLKNIGVLHCSANQGESGDTALFFGLSGTGKTTLSADPKRELIGDDEHGWDNDGVFNFEGGCYAKCIGLSREKEPDIYQAIRKDALLENVDIDVNGVIDFESDKKTQNTRVSYPLYHIDNIVKPVSKGGHPKNIIFLTCDAYGVLPPISKLTKEQVMYHYLSGYTAKVAGTELGIKEPQATFSACFGQAFLAMHPTVYADLLAQKMHEHEAHAYLVNTGWVCGQYGVGHRINLKDNRIGIDAIFDGTLQKVEMETMPIFGLQYPKNVLPGSEISSYNPRNLWEDKDAYDQTTKKLAGMFVENFKKFADNDKGRALVAAGPQLD